FPSPASDVVALRRGPAFGVGLARPARCAVRGTVVIECRRFHCAAFEVVFVASLTAHQLHSGQVTSRAVYPLTAPEGAFICHVAASRLAIRLTVMNGDP